MDGGKKRKATQENNPSSSGSGEFNGGRVTYCSEYNDPYLDSFPPGVRFKPKDKQLIRDYLAKKINNQELPCQRIPDFFVNSCHPLQLAEMFSPGREDEWYFFTSRDKKYLNGTRPNRAAGDYGYWKASGADFNIKFEGQVIGVRKTLVFYEKQETCFKGIKTNWIMHEYRIKEDEDTLSRIRNSGSMKLDEWVLCRIKNHKRKRNSDEEEMTMLATHSEDPSPSNVGQPQPQPQPQPQLRPQPQRQPHINQYPIPLQCLPAQQFDECNLAHFPPSMDNNHAFPSCLRMNYPMPHQHLQPGMDNHMIPSHHPYNINMIPIHHRYNTNMIPSHHPYNTNMMMNPHQFGMNGASYNYIYNHNGADYATNGALLDDFGFYSAADAAECSFDGGVFSEFDDSMFKTDLLPLENGPLLPAPLEDPANETKEREQKGKDN